MPLLLALAALAPLAAGADAGASAPDLAVIEQAVAGFAGAGIGDLGGARAPLDRRLRLQACGAPLALAWRSPRRDTVIVRCPEAGGWTLYVPINVAPRAMPDAAAINRGDSVSIAVSGDGFAVAEAGEALESGALGAWIKVRPETGARPGTGDALRAQVVRPGVVTLILP